MEPVAAQSPAEQGFRLSPQQRRLWRLQESHPGFPYRNRCAFRLEGELDREALASALRRTVARNEILRTTFLLAPGMSLPVQVVREEIAVRIEPADPGAEPLGRPLPGEGLRVGLGRLGEREHELWLDLPALCGDPRSLDHLALEILRDYAHLRGDGEEPGPALQLADIAEWQNDLLESTETADAVSGWREHWREREIPAQLAWLLPFEEAAEGAAFEPDAVAVPLDSGFAAEPGLLLACWQVLLWRSTGRADVLVGVLHEGRGYDELRTALGPFARHLPVHVRLRPEMRLCDLVAASREAVTSAGSRQEHFDWEHVAAETGERLPGFFPACFEATRDPEPREIAGLRLSCVRRAGLVDRFKLALACHRSGGLDHLVLRYDRGRFQPEAMARLAERMGALLRSAADRPEAPLAELEVLGARELRQLLVELGRGPGGAPEPGCLHRGFEQQVERTPERPAVVCGGESLTYRELNERANRLAHHLRALGVGLETPVALCLDRSTQAVVAILGVLKAGGAWVPLDPAQPPGRLRLLLEDTGAPVLLTERRLAGSLAGIPPGVRTVHLDAEAGAIASRPAANPAGGALPGSLAYIIYTSGSTGRPKGVLIEHRSPLALLAGLTAEVLGRHPGPLRASLNAPLIFDASVQQLVLLAAGHTLHIVPEDIRADGEALVRFLREEELDLFDCTPSQLRVLVAAGLLAAEGPAPAIVLVAGEAVDEALWSALGRAGRTAFYNIYGPTECTVDATAHRVGPSGSPAIGRPLAGYEVYLLDPGLRPVPVGAPGEICIGGAGLARGYGGRPDATAERFIPHPFSDRPGARLYRTGDRARHRLSGDLEFLGRLDHQVKIRGFRIELGEIEAALLAHPWVAEAAVTARGEAPDPMRLVAYARLRDGAPAVCQEEIHRSLAARLPDYMIPIACVIVDGFPRLPNGKLNRRALPDPEDVPSAGGKGYEPPRNAIEEILAGLWSELLRLDLVGRRDHFFEKGGHSLLATQLVSRVRDLFQIEIKVRSLFESPILAELAEAVAAAQRSGEQPAAPPLRPVPRGGRLPLSYSQQRLWLHHQMEPASTAYNLPMAVRLRGALDPGALGAAFGEIVRRHEVLRTTFAAGGAEREPEQVIHEPEAFPLPLVDLAPLDSGAAAAAQALLAADARRPFDLARGPVLRALLVKLGEADHVLSVTLHHIVGDAWSTDVLVRELAALYTACREGVRPSLPELPVQYADYASWQRDWLQGGALQEQLAFWRQRLEGAPPLIRLATDRPRPAVQSTRGAQLALELPPELSGRLRELSRAEGCTLFMTLLSSFLVLLHHSSGDDDLVVGSPVSYRNWSEVEGLIGFFVNTLPLRGDLSGDPSFRELMARVRRLSLEAFAYEHLPFDRLIGELRLKRSLSHGSLFQVGFTFQAVHGEPVDLPGLALSPFKVGLETAQFDLNLTMIDTPALTGSLQYSRDLFDEVTIAGMRDQLQRLLERAAEAPDVPLSELRTLLAEADRQRWTAVERDLEQASAQGFRNRKRQSVASPRSQS
jgi:amino acid adenylation domain-containing protein